MKNLTSILLLLILSSQLFASDYLRIGDVQSSWYTYPGSIDKATLVITPKGLFAECQMYLDFSVACTQFSNSFDSLEIQMGFHLPADAEVTDLWLWINNIPVQAGIYDRWTATQVYNSFVHRRTDPALLLKQSDTEYELHIFPLLANLPRKIKMTFLIPFDKLTANQSRINLPLNIINVSSCPVNNVTVAYKEDPNFSNPLLVELPSQSFQPLNDSVIGNCLATTVTSASQLSSLTLMLSANSAENYFAGFNKDTVTNQGVYQLELNLSDILGIQERKKTLFLVDFVQNNSAISRGHVIQSLKNYIAVNFNEGDSVNFMFSGFLTNTISSNWLSADSASLLQIFNSIDSTLITGNSNLPVLFLDGINFIQSKSNVGNIVLISSSSGYSGITQANNLFNDVVTFMGNHKIQIHTIELDDQSYLMSYGTNSYYRGNEYLYRNISAYTGGIFQTVREEWYDNNTWSYQSNTYSYETILGVLFPQLTGYFTALNFSTTLQSGFTFADYDFNSSSGFVYYGSPYRQVGKFYGSFPMQVSISALASSGQLYNSQITIDSTQLISLDTVSESIWAGQHIRSLYSYTQTNNVVYQIIQSSRSARVLSKYTSFLALEPGIIIKDTSFVPTVTGNGGSLGIIETSVSSINVNCYPNPVTTNVNFEFSLPESVTVTVEIFNLFGQRMATVADEKLHEGKQLLTYDTSGFSEGIYFYKIKMNGTEYTAGKIIVVR